MGNTRYLSSDRTRDQQARRRLSEAIRNNQQACWTVLNRTGRKWWQRAYKEPEKWAQAQVNDPHTGEGRRDILFSPDGRIAVAHERKGKAIYAQEVRIPCSHWEITGAREGLATGLSMQSTPALYPLPYAYDESPVPFPGPCGVKYLR